VNEHGESRRGVVSRRELCAIAAAGLASSVLQGCSRKRATPLAETQHLRALDTIDRRTAIAGVQRGNGVQVVEEAVRAAAEAVTDFSWLASGDTVLVKPASNSRYPYPSNTDPRALWSMIRMLKEKGAKRVVVADMSGAQYLKFDKNGPRGSGSREIMQENRIAQAAKDAGGEIQAFEDLGWDGFYEDAPTAMGFWIGPVMMPEVLREVDHVVLMPRCARHIVAGNSLGLKAAVGWWRHDSRLEYHRDAATLQEKTADANTVPTLRQKQRLVLTSATKVLSTFGPDCGYVSEPDTGLVLASTDVVAHDMVSLAWLIENRDAMAPHKREGPIDDPNTSAFVANFANRLVTYWLGGLSESFRTESVRRYPLNSIWQDRTLQRAFEVLGGLPHLELEFANGSTPALLKDKLRQRVTFPS